MSPRRTIAPSFIEKRHASFEAGAQIAAILAQREDTDETAMVRYGTNLGAAFQFVDDALDYDASAEELGKNLGDDLAEGKAHACR